jgi:hypothetical protein
MVAILMRWLITANVAASCNGHCQLCNHFTLFISIPPEKFVGPLNQPARPAARDQVREPVLQA